MARAFQKESATSHRALRQGLPRPPYLPKACINHRDGQGLPEFLAYFDHYRAAAGTFLQNSGQWAVVATFLLAFVKSLPFVAIAIPGTALLVGLGFALGVSGLDVVPLWIAISVGAGFGDWVSYWLGKHFEHVVQDSRLAEKYPNMLPRGEAFFLRWGAVSIVLCRFFGPLRATVPFIAGICRLPFIIFQIANWGSAFLWSASMLAPGVLAAQYLPAA